MKISKEEAKEKLAKIEKQAEQLRVIINAKDDITDRIKTFGDACDELGISETNFNETTRTYCDDTIAYEKLKIIVRALNEGWLPDWKNENEYKYWPYFTLLVGGNAIYGTHAGLVCVNSYNAPAATAANIGSRLCFKSRDLAKYAGNQFNDIYEKFIL
jgi:hypothetical protein